MDLALATAVDAENPIAGDLRLVNGQPQLTEGAEAIAQDLRIRLRFFRGEWFLDLRQGVPYFQSLFRKGASDALIRSTLRRAILSAPGVVAVDRLELVRDRAARSLVVTFAARIAEGETLVFQSFVLEGV